MNPSINQDYRYPERRSQVGSAERNSKAIANALSPFLQKWRKDDDTLRILEIGSGEGKQLIEIANEMMKDGISKSNKNKIIFQPLEAEKQGCKDVDHQTKQFSNGQQENIAILPCQSLEIDFEHDWKNLQSRSTNEYFDVILLFNIVHIVPFSTVVNLFKHFNLQQEQQTINILHPTNGRIVLYGAFDEVGLGRSEGNEKFDIYLKEKNNLFGLRNVQSEIEPLAKQYNLRLEERIDMPNGNLMIIFCRHGNP